MGEAVALIRAAENPIVLAGNGVARVGAASALREFARATGIGVAETFMGKGLLDFEDPRALGTVGLQSRDYALAGFEDADVVITVGYDLVEHAPVNWNPGGDKTIVCVDTVSAEVDEHFMTAVDLVGDIEHILGSLGREIGGGSRNSAAGSRLNQIVLGRFEAARDDEHFPMCPPRALWEIRRALGPRDMLISDVGLHKLWIARMFPAHEPDTVFIANGLAGMGIALPTAIAAKLVHPERKVVTVNGDGGFLMNAQELETAVRLRTAIVNVIWENRQYGSIVWKQDKKFGRHFGTDFTNPDFVRLAEAFGMPAWRIEAVDDFGPALRRALELDLPSLIVLPIDYSLDVAISQELGTETVAA
jgi:acetolactate synthase I/II/III large subunit